MTFESHESNSSFEIGTTTVTYIFEDSSLNNVSCTFNVIVIDNEDPVAYCPADITHTTDDGMDSTVVTWTAPIATDNSGIVNMTFESHESNSIFEIGTTTVTYIFEDSSLNNVSCTFNVIVIDTEDPVAYCPADITHTTNDGMDSAVVTWTAPIATDNSGIVNMTFESHESNSSFEIGTTTVTYIFEDSSLNNVSCIFDVIVIDNEDPVAHCPADITHTTDDGMDSAVVTWTVPIATDNSGIVNMTFESHESNSSFEIGTTTVNYIFEDSSLNNVSCTFNVIVIADITHTTDVGMDSAVVTWTAPIATDNAGIVNMTFESHESNSSFEIGTTTVTYIFEDSSLNNVSCTFNVIVIDNEDPLAYCPTDITQTTYDGMDSAVVTWTAPIATDNSGIVNMTLESHESNSSFEIGTTTVTYIFEDSSLNNVSCTFNVIVIDTEDPVAYCLADITQTTNDGMDSAVVTWTAPTATDNSGIVNMTFESHESNSSFEIGTTT
ncbi:hyalin-like, partial [Saccoglossus kowalevskii]